MEAYIADWVQNIFDYVNTAPWYVLLYHAFVVLVLMKVISMMLVLTTTKGVAHRDMRLSRPFAGGRKILIVGDSTAVGTGAESKEKTIAGMFAHDFPQTDILNVAVNGSLTRDVLRQLKELEGQKFDVIIMSTGGNDVWAMTTMWRLRKDLHKVIQLANSMSGRRVITLFFGNEGSAPLFPFFIRPWLMGRTEKIRKLFQEVTEEENVPFIELFNTTNEYENPFVKEPDKYFAADGLHPNSEGYWLWYKRLWMHMVKENYMYQEEPKISV